MIEPHAPTKIVDLWYLLVIYREMSLTLVIKKNNKRFNLKSNIFYLSFFLDVLGNILF